MEIEFGELPAGGAEEKTRFAIELAAKLRARPGEWAKVKAYGKPSSAASYARHIREANTKAFAPPRTFEAVTRGNDVWARYVGGESA